MIVSVLPLEIEKPKKKENLRHHTVFIPLCIIV